MYSAAIQVCERPSSAGRNRRCGAFVTCSKDESCWPVERGSPERIRRQHERRAPRAKRTCGCGARVLSSSSGSSRTEAYTASGLHCS